MPDLGFGVTRVGDTAFWTDYPQLPPCQRAAAQVVAAPAPVDHAAAKREEAPYCDTAEHKYIRANPSIQREFQRPCRHLHQSVPAVEGQPLCVRWLGVRVKVVGVATWLDACHLILRCAYRHSPGHVRAPFRALRSRRQAPRPLPPQPRTTNSRAGAKNRRRGRARGQRGINHKTGNPVQGWQINRPPSVPSSWGTHGRSRHACACVFELLIANHVMDSFCALRGFVAMMVY